MVRAVAGGPLHDTDEDLVERARRGDVAAYEELVQRYTELAFRTAYLVTGSAAEAQDAVQEALVKAHGALGGFHSGSLFRPWLLSIVGNQARNRRRATGRRAALELRAAERPARGDAVPSPEATLEARERRRALLRALDMLPDDQRQVVVCRYLLELSGEETATALGVPEGTVKSRLARALLRLRDLMEPAWHG